MTSLEEESIENSYCSVKIKNLAFFNTNKDLKDHYEKLILKILHKKIATKNISVFQRKSKLIGDQGKGVKKITFNGGLQSIG